MEKNLINYLNTFRVKDEKSLDYLLKYMHQNKLLQDYDACKYVQDILRNSNLLEKFNNVASKYCIAVKVSKPNNDTNKTIQHKKTEKNNDTLKQGNWAWIHCGDGRCIFAPSSKSKPQIIESPYLRKRMNVYIVKYMEELPKFSWTLDGKNKVKVSDKKLIVDTILRLAQREKSMKQTEIVKKAFVVRGRVPNKKVDAPISFSTDLVLQWEDVKFYDRYYIFKPKLEGKIGNRNISPLKVENFRCKKSFNYILKYFQARLPKIIYRITPDYKIKLENEPAFETVLIDLAKEHIRLEKEIEIKHTERTIHKLGFSEAMSKARTMSIEEFKKYKSKFIDFLVDHQSKEHKIVPVTESISHRGTTHDEQGFIFTVKVGFDYLLIIVENVNPDRSTMLFQVSEWNYRVALHAIFDYVQSDEINKRSAVRDHNIGVGDAGIRDYWTSNHDSFHDWKYRLLAWFR